MKKALLLVMIACSCMQAGFSQTALWYHKDSTYGMNQGRAINTDIYGNYHLLAPSAGTFDSKCVYVSLTSDGNLRWSKLMNTKASNNGNSPSFLASDKLGYSYVAGTTTDALLPQVTKFDSSGTAVWTYQSDSTFPYYLDKFIVSPANEPYLFGYYIQTIVIIKLDPSTGQIAWIDTPYRFQAPWSGLGGRNVVFTPNGDFVTRVTIPQFNGTEEGKFLFKVSGTDGQISIHQNSTPFDTGWHTYGPIAYSNFNGKLYEVAMVDTSYDAPPCLYCADHTITCKVAVSTLDSAGNYIWTKYFNEFTVPQSMIGLFRSINNIHISATGDVYILGLDYFAGNTGWLTKTSAAGDSLWTIHFEKQPIYAVKGCGNDVIVYGNDSLGSVIHRIDANGTVQKTLRQANTSLTEAAVDPDLNILMTGLAFDYTSSANLFVTKFGEPVATGIQEQSTARKPFSVSVAPNPSTGIFSFTTYAPLYNDVTIEIRNLLGQLVFTAACNNVTTVADISTACNGLYIYNLRQGSKVLQTGKIIKTAR